MMSLPDRLLHAKSQSLAPPHHTGLPGALISDHRSQHSVKVRYWRSTGHAIRSWNTTSPIRTSRSHLSSPPFQVILQHTLYDRFYSIQYCLRQHNGQPVSDGQYASIFTTSKLLATEISIGPPRRELTMQPSVQLSCKTGMAQLRAWLSQGRWRTQ